MKRALLVLAALCSLAGRAQAAPRRFALLVGENTGDEGDATLHYAESDAQRIGRVLRDFGGFGPEDLVALNDVNAEEMRGALIAMNSRIREVPNATLFVFYSGHADAEALHLRGSRLSVEELRSLVHGSPAAARVLVIDACRSGAVTRVKGGRIAPSFAVDVEDHLAAEGMAILTSSAAGEDSQESDRIGASFFTHYLASGLLGAADEDADGRVTLDEAFHYASERTLVATTGTLTGPQHPTYRFELGGQGALVLTEPSRVLDRFGSLAFPAGTWLVQRSTDDGPVVAEIGGATARRQVSLPAGRYFVSRRERDHLLEGSFAVSAGATTEIVPREMREVAYAQVVRKGGTSRTRTWSAWAAGQGRSGLLDIGAAPGFEGGARLDLRPVSFDLRVSTAAGSLTTPTPNGPLYVSAREYALTLAALRVFDVGRFSIGVGGEVGASRLDRAFDHVPAMPPPQPAPPPHIEIESLGVFTGPTASVEVPLWRAVHARAGLSWDLETVQAQSPPPQRPGTRDITHGVVRGTLGVGVFF